MKISSIVFIFSFLFTSCVNNYKTIIEVIYPGGQQKDTLIEFSRGPFSPMYLSPIYQLDDGCLKRSQTQDFVVCDVRHFRIIEQKILE